MNAELQIILKKHRWAVEELCLDALQTEVNGARVSDRYEEALYDGAIREFLELRESPGIMVRYLTGVYGGTRSLVSMLRFLILKQQCRRKTLCLKMLDQNKVTRKKVRRHSA